MPDITSPTVWSGITNTVDGQAGATISANLTLTDRTFYRFWRYPDPKWSTTSNIVVAPTAADVLVTVQGASGFLPAYRSSGTDSVKWLNTGLDPVGYRLADSTYHFIRLGVQDGEAGSTGEAKFLLDGNPSFGRNSSFPLMVKYFRISSSVKSNPETGYVDFLELKNGAKANISSIQVEGTTPARILFHKNCYLWHDNAISAGKSSLCPLNGATLILESADNEIFYYHKQFIERQLTDRKTGSRVRIIGKDFALHSDGSYGKGSTGENYKPWKLSSNDNISWEITGDLHLSGYSWLITETDDVLPHGKGTGRIVIEPSGSKFPNTTFEIPYSCLDLYGTSQKVNGLTSTGTKGYDLGVITNTASATGYLVLGADGIDGELHARCTANVVVKKQGTTSTLTVSTAYGEELVVEEGEVVFTGDNVFTNITLMAGTQASGAVTVLGKLTIADNVDAEFLNVTLGDAAKISGTVRLEAVTRGGTAVDTGIYTPTTAADWVDADSAVTVTYKTGMSATAIEWKGEGATDSATTAANWNGGEGFSADEFMYYKYAPVFATGGTSAKLDGGLYYWLGLAFDTAGDFTVTTNAVADGILLKGQITLAEKESPNLRTYTVAAPVRIDTALALTIHTNTTLKLTGGMSGTGSLTMQGDKLSDMTYDYSTAGTLDLENVRISGKIDHQKGALLILRGEIGEPNNPSQGALVCDYGHYRNGSNNNDGVVPLSRVKIQNVTMNKPVSIAGKGQVDTCLNYWWEAYAHTTNVFKAPVTMVPSTMISGEAGAVYIFEDTVTVTGGSFNPYGRNTSDPTEFYFKKAAKTLTTIRAFNPNNAARLHFQSTGNRAALFYQGGNSSAYIEVDDAFDNTGFLLCGSSDVLEIGATHQKMRYLVAGTSSDFKAAGNKVLGTVRGTAGAEIEITEGAPTADATSITNCGVKFEGAVSLTMTGKGWHRMIGKLAHTSTGDVTVTGGVLSFDANATWLNGRSVTVAGAGTLQLLGGATFSKQAELHLGAQGDTWTIDIPEGVTQRFAYAYDENGKALKSGTYGSVASGAANVTYAEHFTGKGQIVITRHSTVIYLR